MNSTGIRKGFVYAFLVLYVLYALGNIGMTGLLFSFAVGLIVSGLDYDIELTSAAIILAGLLWKVLFERKKENFVGEPVGDGQSLKAISKRVEQLQQRNVFEPTGVLSSNFAEGFADATTTDSNTNAQGSSNTSNATATSTSTPAPTNAPTASTQMADAAAKSAPAAASTPATQQTPPNPDGSAAKPTTSGFADPKTDGMFKLGSIPSDAAGGAHIDVGTTLMNALNSLKPDQVKQMTEDTRKLMETQKSLMGMLTTMKPMLQDGREMMNTFGEMFGDKK
jgi:hypothetical protein